MKAKQDEKSMNTQIQTLTSKQVELESQIKQLNQTTVPKTQAASEKKKLEDENKQLEQQL